MESILTSIKKMLGIAAEYEHFDADIVMHINSVFLTLSQIGVGPTAGFSIKDELAVWSDFLPEEHPALGAVKSYMYLKVKLLFDPPNSGVTESMNRMISEFEWRINHAAETTSTE